MLVFAAVAYDGPQTRQETEIDESLFPQIAAGEQAAFHALYQQTSGSVFAFALSLLRNRPDAEDVAQDVYLKIRAAAHLYRPQGKPMAWILTITRNLCLMKMRQEKRFAGPVDEANGAFGFDQIEDVEDRLVLEAAFRTLSQEECRIIMLHAVSGPKHREISAILGLPVSTVLSKYNRGLKKLRRELEGTL